MIEVSVEPVCSWVRKMIGWMVQVHRLISGITGERELVICAALITNLTITKLWSFSVSQWCTVLVFYFVYSKSILLSELFPRFAALIFGEIITCSGCFPLSRNVPMFVIFIATYSVWRYHTLEPPTPTPTPSGGDPTTSRARVTPTERSASPVLLDPVEFRETVRHSPRSVIIFRSATGHVQSSRLPAPASFCSAGLDQLGWTCALSQIWPVL